MRCCTPLPGRFTRPDRRTEARVSAHLKVCPQCVREYRLVKRSAQLISSLEASEPSARVDAAVMAAIAARAGTNSAFDTSASLRSIPYNNRNSARNRRRRVPIGSLVGCRCVLVVALVGVLHFVIMPGSSCICFSGSQPGPGMGLSIIRRPSFTVMGISTMSQLIMI